ncbi:glycerol-3-phosphate dehydrogenase/oxidase [Niabella aquatica]
MMSIGRGILTGKLRDENFIWDILVIGGGATGLGIALDAVTRGYKVLLVEQSDFAKGTSSRSTKLVHGGVRYLAQGDVALVREASKERGLLRRNAPHLVKNQTFVIPVYNWLDKIKYGIGLKMYDWIAGRLSLGPSLLISKEQTTRALPGIVTKGLKGGVKYHDGQFDDSRLAINLVQTIIEQGGYAVNYIKVVSLLKDAAGKVSGATVQDEECGDRFLVHAKAVVNATGVFVDGILKMDDPGARNSVVASQGIHLVFDKALYSSEHALMIPKTSDGRVLFAVPWHQEVVVGTTDTLVGEPSLEPRALEEEVNFILNTASQYLTKKLARKEVKSIYVGLRPLAAPQEGSQKTKEISRSHKILHSGSYLFTVIGGKWTTFRKMGEDMVDYIEKELNWSRTISVSKSFKIHGYQQNVDWMDPLYFYGSDAEGIRGKLAGKNDWLSERLRIYRAQLDWAVRHEMARTVEDFLARRTRALFLDAEESMRMAPEVAELMAILLDKEKSWAEEQVTAFNKIAEKYRL